MLKELFATIDDYEQYIGVKAVERIKKKAAPLEDLRIVHINSTFYGGGVAELLSSLTLLMNTMKIKTGWRIIQGSPDFFSVTKKIHNALQGKDINLTRRKLKVYEDLVYENAVRMHLDHDFIVVNDPQPLPLITHYRKKNPWIWCCHIELESPHGGLWRYLKTYIEKYDCVILSSKRYRKKLSVPQFFFMPAIDPFTLKNRELPEEEIKERLEKYHIPTDLPLVVQISRFDRWKDPEGVIKAFKIARREVDCTLVLLGNVATDDPEGPKIYESLLKEKEDRIIILSHQDSALVNTLQRKAAVVLQKSIREGFGLTVTEAMWKGAAVIGGNTGGIRCQIKNGVNGFLVSSVNDAARRIVQLLKDKRLRAQLGTRAHESVLQNFLMTRYAEQYLDLFASFRSDFTATYKQKVTC